jgi:bifunctional DNase/RNase
MSKVQVDILGLSSSQAGTNAFALILKEAHGPRRLTIVIGVPEAQAIANELEGIMPQRPMTHDLLRKVIEGLGGTLQEVVINNLVDGTYYASLVFAYSGLEIDARPSDAIALAVRVGVPIYVEEHIMNEAGVAADDSDDAMSLSDEEDDEDARREAMQVNEADLEAGPIPYREQLMRELEEAIRVEDYERAARLRDELQRLEGNA